MKILLIGAGNMGGAMIDGLSSYELLVIDKNQEKLDTLKKRYPKINTSTNLPNLDGYMVVLAIKPSSLASLAPKGTAWGLISILAGVSIKNLKEKINAKHYVRAMPNMAAVHKKSATCLCGDEELKNDALDILSSIGKCFWLNSEDELDVAMGLVGCAPAWLALTAEALSDGAVNLGLKRDISYEMISALFEGTGVALKSEHPAVLKDKITSPKGTTIAGVKALEEGGVRDAFMEAMLRAYGKTKEE